MIHLCHAIFRYGTKADVWSAGMIAYILLSGIMPFRQRKKPANSVPSKFSFPSAYWEDVSKEAKDFIRHLLVVSPQERYSSSHLMQHTWLKVKFSIRLCRQLPDQSTHSLPPTLFSQKAFVRHSNHELSKKLVEYLNNRAEMKVSPVPMLTVRISVSCCMFE